ncbi:VP2 [Banna-like virus strain Balaton/2010/HUN]|nr:VP2 [Banna-like virus strain Balaton/2010/HUN]
MPRQKNLVSGARAPAIKMKPPAIKTATDPGSEAGLAILSIQNPRATDSQGSIVFDGQGVQPVVETKSESRPTASNGAVIDGRLPHVEVKTAEDVQSLSSNFKNVAFDPMTVKNNTDVVDKLHASQKSSLQEVIPTKEMAPSMTFGITVDDVETVLQAANKSNHSTTTSAFATIKRGTQSLLVKKNFDHNLKIVMAANGRNGLIQESLGSWKVDSNVELRAQAGLIAVKLARMLGIDKPFIMDIGSNYETINKRDPNKYCLDGLQPDEIAAAINRQRSFYDRNQLTKEERSTLLAQSIVYSNVDGSDTSVLFSGALTHALVVYAQEQWAMNVIPLNTYIDEITATLPDYYRVKRFTGLEHKHGYVYRELSQGSLMPLVNTLLNDVSQYYFNKLMGNIADVPVNVITIQSATAQLSADTSQSTSRAQYVTMLTGNLTTANAPRMRAITVLTCMFPRFNIDMVYADSPIIRDVCAAACMLLFRPAHCITDELYHYSLLYIASFLTNTTPDALRHRDLQSLRNLLDQNGWRLTQRYNANRLTFRHEPLRSPGVVGEYFVPFNINPNTGRHVEDRLDGWLDDIARARFKNLPSLGATIAAFLRQCVTRTHSYWQDYATLISRYRGLIPQELYESLTAVPGDYNISVNDEFSFFFTLAKIDLTDAFIGGIDIASDEYLSEYATLARDISLSLTLVNSVFKELPRDSGSIIAQANAMNIVLNEVFSDRPLISELMLTLLSMDAPDGREGYRNFLRKLVGHNYPVYNEPAMRIIDYICARVIDNSSYFGYTDEILVLPRNVIIPTDERFGFRDSPFCQALPTHAMGGEIRRIDYAQFVRLDRARTAISQGLIIHGAHFNYDFELIPEDGVTRLENDIFLTTDVRNEVKPIKFLIHFENFTNPELEDLSGLNIAYKLYIRTPASLLPLNDYMRSQRRINSPSSSRVYINTPALVYTRS